MVRILIVEDEPLLLRSIRQTIEESHKGFLVIGEAYNGIEALRHIDKECPDVVFTDIKMPLMDGIELITQIRERKPEILPVILSGYSDFEYARTAIKLNVYDYLLKPCPEELIQKLLDDIYDRVENRKKQEQLKVLNEVVNSETPLEKKFVLPSGSEAAGGYFHMLLCAGSISRFLTGWLTPAKEFWIRNSLDELVVKYIPSNADFWVVNTVNVNEKTVVLRSAHNEGINRCFENIFYELAGIGFPVTAVIGREAENLMDLAVYVKLTRIEINRSLVFGKSLLIYSERGSSSEKEFATHLDSSLVKALQYHVENKNADMLKKEIKRIFEFYDKNDCTQIYLEALIQQILKVITDCLDMSTNLNYSQIEMEIKEVISYAAGYSSLLQGLGFIVDNLLTRHGAIKNTGKSSVAQRAHSFIQANYTNLINLGALAENLGVSAPYLTKIYKEEYGCSPNDHIINLRVEKVKELIHVQPPLLLKEISEMVGYEDPYYMSRIFKSVTGKNPTEYRNNL